MKFQNQVLSLHSDALPPDTLMVAKLTGQERISGLFRFELDLICNDPELDLEQVLYAPAQLRIKSQVKLADAKIATEDREIAGVFEEFEQLDEGQGWTRYRAVLVPKLWNTTRSHRSRIFQEMTIEDVVGAVLEKDGLESGIDFEFQLQRAGDEDPKERAIYPEREYVVQYEESDWQFLARWLEHEGIYFYFVNDYSADAEGNREKVVFADTESAYARSTFGTSYPYRPESKGEGTDSDKFAEEEIRTFRCRQTRLPTSVAVNDYNWRVPSARLFFTEDVREHGTGQQTEYNDHFKDEAQGKALAKIRREELECRSRVFHGTGSCRAFRPGTTFELEEHFRSDFNRSYLLVSVEHEAEQMISLETSTVTGVKYENTFTAITDDQPWRPERVTDWPAIKGVMNARVDAEGDGQYAELDEHGRYKLKMPYDECSDEAPDGKASRWVRMAQPYAGTDSGMHFPLLKGTEVLITHIDGDPDRPVISGAVPNPETESPSTGANPSTNSLRTTTGNLLAMDDHSDCSGFVMMDAARSFVSDTRQRHTLRRPDDGGQQGGGNGGADAAQPDMPAGGSGNATTGQRRRGSRQPTTTPATPVDSWKEFFANRISGTSDKTAFALTRDRGTLQSEQRTNDSDDHKPVGMTYVTDFELSDDHGSALTSAPSAGVPLTEKNICAALNYALGKTGSGGIGDHDIGEEDVSGTEATGAIGKLLGDEAGDLTLSAKGTKLKLFLDDNVTFSIGDNYKYADGSNDVSIGTGGNSYSETLADSYSKSRTWGLHESQSEFYGRKTERSYTFSGVASFSTEFSGKASMSITVSTETNTSINLGIINANSIFIGGKMSLDVNLSARGSIEIAPNKFEIKILPKDDEIDISSKFGLQIQNKKVTALKDQIAINNTANEILRNDNAISKLSKTVIRNKMALQDTKQALNDNTQALQESVTFLSNNQTSLNHNDVALSAANTAMLKKMNSAVTMM